VSHTKKFSGQTEADFYYMAEAFAERASTDDPRGKIIAQSSVGAVIAERGRIIASSANVLPPPLKKMYLQSTQEVTDNDRYHVIEHAERAAIFKAFRNHADMAKATIYCTRFPCSDCARAIVWSGIKRAVFAGGFAGEKRWLSAQRAALKILRDSGVTVRYLSVNNAVEAVVPESLSDAKNQGFNES
jgi:dCMP deaminase